MNIPNPVEGQGDQVSSEQGAASMVYVRYNSDGQSQVLVEHPFARAVSVTTQQCESEAEPTTSSQNTFTATDLGVYVDLGEPTAGTEYLFTVVGHEP